LLPRLDRRALRPLFLATIEALGAYGGPDAVEALTAVRDGGGWWARWRTRADRKAAADALRRIASRASALRPSRIGAPS
ncbi:MAG TPA: hypothetical protein VNI83_01880, partial [Vicinamibacterales bacterium]|nr:hypothetical protein [Vicinamibacterales bacterium]